MAVTSVAAVPAYLAAMNMVWIPLAALALIVGCHGYLRDRQRSIVASRERRR